MAQENNSNNSRGFWGNLFHGGQPATDTHETPAWFFSGSDFGNVGLEKPTLDSSGFSSSGFESNFGKDNKPTTIQTQGSKSGMNKSDSDTTLSTTEGTDKTGLSESEIGKAPMDFSFIDARILGKKKDDDNEFGLDTDTTLSFTPIDPDTGVKVAGPDMAKTVEDYDNDIKELQFEIDASKGDVDRRNKYLEKYKKEYEDAQKAFDDAQKTLREAQSYSEIAIGLSEGIGKDKNGKIVPGDYKSGDTEYSITKKDGKTTVTNKTNGKSYIFSDKVKNSFGAIKSEALEKTFDLTEAANILNEAQKTFNETTKAFNDASKYYEMEKNSNPEKHLNELIEKLGKLRGLRENLVKENERKAAEAREAELAKKAEEEAKRKATEAAIAKSNEKIEKAGKEYAEMEKPKIETPDNPAPENTAATDWKSSDAYNNLSEDKKSSLYEIEQAYNSAVKVNDDEEVTSVDPEAYKAAQDKHKELIKSEEENLHKTIMDIVDKFQNEGMDVSAAYKEALASPEVTTAAQQLYDFAQASLDMAMEVQEFLPKVHNKKDVKESEEKWANITGVNELSKKDVKNIVKYMKGDNYQKVVDASTALAKAAAELGATDTKGGRFSEAWKHQSVDLGRIEEGKNKDDLSGKQKFSIKDILSTVATGTLGTLTTLVGVAIAPENPLLGAAVIGSGVSKLGKATVGKLADKAVDKSTNKEYMFGSGNTYTDVMTGVKKHSDDSAYSGLPTNPQTYKNLIGSCFGAMEVLNGAIVFDPVQILDGLTSLKDSFNKVKNPASRQAKALQKWAEEFYEVMHEDPNILRELGVDFKDNYEGPNGGSKPPVLDNTSFGAGSGKLEDELNSSFSGYKEQAKDSNISKDYNEGMEEESNQAVSDKYCKQFRTLFRNEPEVVRKYIIGVIK